MIALGIDVGGTNLKGIVMNEDGSHGEVTRIPTEASQGGSHVEKRILKLVETLLEQVEDKSSIVGVGIGTPGFVDEDGVILGGAENIPGWKGTQLIKPITDKFGFKAYGANDVTITALAEARYGAGRGVDNMVCLALGTGIGGGLFLNGQLYTGTHGMAGELGHICVEENGIQCNCGQKGCVEQYASATGIAKVARRVIDETSQTTPFVEFMKNNYNTASAKEIYQFAEQENPDPVATEVHKIVCQKLAIACGIIGNIFAPDRIVLGGGVMKSEKLMLPEIKKHFRDYCWDDIADRCEIVVAELSEDAGVVGAAQIAFENYRKL